MTEEEYRNKQPRDIIDRTAYEILEARKQREMKASSQEEYIYRRALESIRAELTSFDPDGDDVNYDRELAIVEVLKIIKIVLGPDGDGEAGEE